MTSDRIKANRAKEVKLETCSGSAFPRVLIALVGFGFAFAAYADDSSPTSPTENPPPIAEPTFSGGAPLPSDDSGIEAKRYQVQIIKRAGSSPIFLFENQSHTQPRVGKILLLKHDAEPVMAVRVLRSDTDKKRFAGRAIKFYGSRSKTLRSGESLTVLERSDGAPPPVAPPSVTPDQVPVEPVVETPPPIEPAPAPLAEPAPPPIPDAPVPPPVPEPSTPEISPIEPVPVPPVPTPPTPKAPTAPTAPTATDLVPKTPPKPVLPKAPEVKAPEIKAPEIKAPTSKPASDSSSTPSKKLAVPTIPRPPIPEIPRPDSGAGPGMGDINAPPPVPDPMTPETSIPTTDGSAPPTAPSSKNIPTTDTLKSALSAPTQVPGVPDDAGASTTEMLQQLEAQTQKKIPPPDAPPADAPPPDAPPPDAPVAEAPPADAPPPDVASQELQLDDAPPSDVPAPDPNAPPDPNAVTELDTSGMDAALQENPQSAAGDIPADTMTDAPPIDAPAPEDAAPPEEPRLAPEDIDDSKLGMAIEEVYPIDPHSQGLTFSFGAFRNNGPPDNPNAVYFFGGGLRYALMLGHMIFAQGAHVQDSFAIEPGIFYYKLVNFIAADDGDAFTLVPLIGTLRYTLMFGENFSFFLYGGLMYNYVAQSSGPEGQTFDDAKANLGSTIPAMGAGMIFRVGPNWDFRLDLGTDVAQLGLMLRF